MLYLIGLSISGFFSGFGISKMMSEYDYIGRISGVTTIATFVCVIMFVFSLSRGLWFS